MLAFLLRNPMLIFAAVVSLALGGTVGVMVGKWTGIQIGREQGTAAERAVWQENQRAAEAKAEKDRRTAQAKIDAVEREYYERDKARVLAMTALEKSLEEEQAHVPIPTSRDASCVGRPAVSRGVRDALQDLGRAAPGGHPAEPDAAVRRSR